MNTPLFKNIIFSAAVAMFATSCVNSNDQGGITKAIGDAAVDSATQNSDIVTKTAIRNATGYGTDPIEEKTTGFLNSLGL